MSPTRVIRGRRVVTPGGIRAAAIHIDGGVVASVVEYDDVPDAGYVIDVGDAVLLPGLVDTHVHINEPGRTEWEGFETATLAAVAGGVTTLVDMPLNAIPATTSVAALDAKRRAAEGRCRVDVGFWGGLVPGSQDELEPLLGSGALGFKCFLVDSGVPEFPAVGEAELRAALPVLAAHDAPLLVHAEVPDALVAPLPGANPRSHATWLATRPAAAEVAGVELLVRLSRDSGVRIHIVHVSAADVLPILAKAREQGVRVTAETCPHYLALTAEQVPDGATEFKCAPPIRESRNRERLWQALASGVLDMIASDHSPAPPAMKLPAAGDFLRAWGGIASLQLGLSLVWSEARARGHGYDDVARWLAAAPAALAGFADRKGTIAPGRDADLVVWRPDAEWTVTPDSLRHRHPLTPYNGRTLAGVVESVYLRGERIFDRGEDTSPAGGRLLTRQERSWTSQN